MQGSKIMEALIDKLCDHLSTDRIKLLIESGFDEWETVTYMNGSELAELGYTPEECIIAMVAINATAKEVNHKEIFSEQTMQKVLSQAKEKQKDLEENMMREQTEHKIKQMKIEPQEKWEPQDVKEFPPKPINEAILQKGVTLKGKDKVPLNKITLITLQEKEITHISEMEKVPNLQNLYLGQNHIYRIENIDCLHKLKILKLERNEICQIQGLNHLQSLEQIFLNENHISRFEGFQNNRKLHFINISGQKTKRPLVFDEETCQALSYTLQSMNCDNNRVNNINSLKHLKVLSTLSFKNNSLGDMGDLSEPLGSMERLKKLDFRGNPLAGLPKYRDYIVILAKNLQQLDTKNILPTERQYLVKLYSLKHAKQMRQQNQGSKKNIPKAGEGDLQVIKLQEGVGIGQYTHGGDLRGNAAYANTKIQKK